MLCGGTHKVQTATADIQKIAEEMKSHAEEKTGKKFTVFEAKTFTTQVVAGTNYFIKVHVGNEEYIHLRVYEPLPHTNQKRSLHSVEHPKQLGDELKYFG
ncbi:cystatin-B-like [Petromyzon marinus]|uniref:Cystatin-B-like n=1 Tax=Petromyzon marinus TaxID=7757 RepID=A0AAJ7XGK2_PETMA|nr:cystatin-B-like [Petromyzon marinus]XP_032832494.1 cystatin-B-like [Petromyzon marinus]XP_032832495.1 cystatin-B-like [Petromyzon marinus]